MVFERAERYPCGKRRPSPPKSDTGTAETILRRLAAVGPFGDPVRAHYPLGAALERKIITIDQHQAGLNYARAFCVAIGRPLRIGAPQASLDLSDDRRAALTALWRSYGDSLNRLKAKTLIDGVILYECWPPWLFKQAGHEAKIDMFRRGLDAITAI